MIIGDILSQVEGGMSPVLEELDLGVRLCHQVLQSGGLVRCSEGISSSNPKSHLLLDKTKVVRWRRIGSITIKIRTKI